MRVNLFGPAPQQLQLPTACRAQRPEPSSGIPIRDGASFPLALGLCLLCHRGCCFPHVRLQDSAKARSPASPSPQGPVPGPPGRGPGGGWAQSLEREGLDHSTPAPRPPSAPSQRPDGFQPSEAEELLAAEPLQALRGSSGHPMLVMARVSGTRRGQTPFCPGSAWTRLREMLLGP